jgi:cation diffusion facilitator family transporter
MSSSNTSSMPDAQEGIKVTLVGSLANTLLIILKFWGGLLGNSQALVADAVHSISDLASDAVVLLGLKWGRKPADQQHPYGHGRIETIAGMAMGLLLIVVGCWIGFGAVDSIAHPVQSQPSLLAIVVAFISVAVKEALYWYTVAVGRKLRSMAIIGNAWHHRSDALSSVAVLVGVIVAYLNPAWFLADAYAALIVSFFIIKVGSSLVWAAFKEVVDTSPGEEILQRIHDIASGVEGATDIHDIMARQSGPHIYVDMHIVVDPSLTVREGHRIAKQIEANLFSDITEIARVTIHVDPDVPGHH